VKSCKIVRVATQGHSNLYFFTILVNCVTKHVSLHNFSLMNKLIFVPNCVISMFDEVNGVKDS